MAVKVISMKVYPWAIAVSDTIFQMAISDSSQVTSPKIIQLRPKIIAMCWSFHKT